MFYFLFKFNKKNKALKVVLFYIIYCILNEATSFYLQSNRSQNTVLLFILFTVVEFSFFSFFIYIILPVSWIKRAIPFVAGGFIVFALSDYFFFTETNQFDSIAIGIESIIILILCISYLFIQIKGANSLLIYSTFNFWVVIAFLIYFSGTFFLYLMTDRMMSSPSFQKLYLIINISFNIIKNILLCVAMTMKLNHTVSEQKNVIPDLDDDLYIQKQNNYLN